MGSEPSGRVRSRGEPSGRNVSSAGSSRGRRSRDRGADVESLGELLDRWLRKNKVRQRVDANSLYGRWRDVVGEKLSRETRVVDVRAGELIVEVSSSALLNEMSTYGRQDILESLRGIDEFRGVKTIRFRLGTR